MYLSIYPSIHLYIYLSIYLSISLSLSLSLSICIIHIYIYIEREKARARASERARERERSMRAWNLAENMRAELTGEEIRNLEERVQKFRRLQERQQAAKAGTKSTCFTGTKVQILTPEELPQRL